MRARNFYGVSPFDVELCQEKLDSQREYMRSFSFVNSLGQVRNLLDISMSANFSPKYYAEVSNRVNVFSSFAIDNFLVPVFLTITLNGCFRGALNGDYSKFKPIDYKYLPDEIKYKAKNLAPLTISDLVAVLNHQWNLFIMRYSDKFKKVDRSYIRCFEPHKKDGVPHIHALFYVPAYTLDFMKRIYCNIFYAPQNLKTDAITSEQEKNGELNGFQTSINNPSGYVMKYIQKTFINLKETQDFDELSAWYVKHKVRRFLSSRTKVPLWVYRKINFISSMQDFYHLNDLTNDHRAILEWNKKDDYIYINLPFNKEEIIYLNGRLEHYISGRLMNFYDRLKIDSQKDENAQDEIKSFGTNLKQRQILKLCDELFKSDEKPKPVSRMKDYELVNYYQSLGGDVNAQHLAYVENLMLDRELDNFTHYHKKHDLNTPDIDSFVDRLLICNEF